MCARNVFARCVYSVLRGKFCCLCLKEVGIFFKMLVVGPRLGEMSPSRSRRETMPHI